jgi:predicted ATPase
MLAPSLQETAFLSEAHRALGISMFNLGQSGTARKHLERALALYRPDQHSSYSSLYGIDPAVTGLSLLARPLWHLGYPDQALASVHEALARVQHQFQPYSQVYALSIAAQLHQFRQEAQAVIAQTEAVNLLATKHGFAFFVTVGKMLEGWALTKQGQVERGIMQLRDGLIAFDSSGLQLAKPYYLALLAEAHQAIGETQEALDRIDQALAIVDKTAERWYEAELQRLRGEALQMQGAEEQEVASSFLKALALARQQEAKSLELRTAISLSRLWQKHNRQQARELLTVVYGWFREGLDTPDLKTARLLLADL